MKTYIFILFLFIISASIYSCKDPDEPQDIIPPDETKITYTLDSISTLPGLFLTIKSNVEITKDTGAVLLGGKSVLMFKIDSFHYALNVPVISPGTYLLDLKNFKAKNTPKVVVRNYEVISNPDEIIATVINNYNTLAESLEKNSQFNSNAAQDAIFIHQLISQFNENIKIINSEEKQLLAYQLQYLSPILSMFKKASIDTKRLVASSTDNQDNIEKALLISLANFERKKLAAFKQAALTSIFISAATVEPTKISVLAAIISTSLFFLDAKDAAESIGEAVNIAFLGIDLTEKNENGTNTNPIISNKDLPVWLRYIVKYRTLQRSDESSTNSVMSTAIKSAYELEIKDKSIKDIFEDMKNKLSSFFGNISATYSAFVSPVLDNAKEELVELPSQFLAVSSVSNPNILVTAIEDGTQGLKLNFTNPSNNITEETNFTFQLTYRQEAINNNVTITHQGKFIPLPKPKVTTTIVGSITATSAISGGIITDDGGGEIIAKGICYSTNPNPTPDILNTVPGGTGTGSFIGTMTQLNPNTEYHVRAFATNSAGTAYGDDVPFKTKPVSKEVGTWELIETGYGKIPALYAKYQDDYPHYYDKFLTNGSIEFRQDGTVLGNSVGYITQTDQFGTSTWDLKMAQFYGNYDVTIPNQPKVIPGPYTITWTDDNNATGKFGAEGNYGPFYFIIFTENGEMKIKISYSGGFYDGSKDWISIFTKKK